MHETTSEEEADINNQLNYIQQVNSFEFDDFYYVQIHFFLFLIWYKEGVKKVLFVQLAVACRLFHIDAQLLLTQ